MDFIPGNAKEVLACSLSPSPFPSLKLPWIQVLPTPHLVQSHSHSAAVFLSLVRCLGLLQVLWREEAPPHPRGACRTVEGAAHVSVTLCGPAGNGIAVAPPEACSGRRLAVVRSALPPFWHCCHHWLVAMESCQSGWRPLVGLNLVSSLRALKENRMGSDLWNRRHFSEDYF